MRAIAASAVQEDLRLILADLHDNTFPMLNGHPNLLAPVAHTINEFIDRMHLIRDVIEQRKAAFQALHAQGLYPDDLAEFNAHVEPAQRLPRVIALFDELSSACDQPDWAALAYDLGYSSQQHFITNFKRVLGKTPVQYKKELTLQQR